MLEKKNLPSWAGQAATGILLCDATYYLIGCLGEHVCLPVPKNGAVSLVDQDGAITNVALAAPNTVLPSLDMQGFPFSFSFTLGFSLKIS